VRVSTRVASAPSRGFSRGITADSGSLVRRANPALGAGSRRRRALKDVRRSRFHARRVSAQPRLQPRNTAGSGSLVRRVNPALGAGSRRRRVLKDVRRSRFNARRVSARPRLQPRNTAPAVGRRNAWHAVQAARLLGPPSTHDSPAANPPIYDARLSGVRYCLNHDRMYWTLAIKLLGRAAIPWLASGTRTMTASMPRILSAA